MKQNNFFVPITALYCRLSSEDKHLSLGEESNSIANQKQILLSFAQSKHFNNFRFFIDDGWSGTDFNRPAFNTMMELAKKGQIGTIIVKDLSRLGRNYLKAGELIEIVFPKLNVRFIAVNDNVDTSFDDNEMIVFKNLFNDWYAKDTSKKIKAVKYSRSEHGQRTNGSFPYGYRPSPKNRSLLVVDEEAAQTVRLIFYEFAAGKSMASIIRSLKSKKILRPSAYRCIHHIPPYSKSALSSPYTWNAKTIYDILKRREYIGDTVTHKYTVASYKTHKLVKLPDEAHFIFEHTHEPIISPELWNFAQKRLENRTRPTRLGTIDLYSGILYCGDCQNKLSVYRRDPASSFKTFYMCSGYKRGHLQAKPCTTHYIRKELLDSILLFSLEKELKANLTIKKELVQRLSVKLKQLSRQNQDLEDRERSALKKRKKEFGPLLKQLYEDFSSGHITEKHFQAISAEYEKEQEDIVSRLIALTNKNAAAGHFRYTEEALSRLIDSYLPPKDLTYEMIRLLIDKIYIFETNSETEERAITIYFKYSLPVFIK